MQPPLFAVVLAGGFGTRFWPASRKSLPKQFLRIGGSRSLIQETVARLEGLVPIERVLVVTAREHEALVRKHLKKLPAENVLAEPVGRNTAACAAWAALEIERRAKDSVHALLPSDHVIEPAEKFRAALAAAAEEAHASGKLVTFGVRPTFPATGYGYIETRAKSTERLGHRVHDVARFVEKPPLEKARRFVASGRHLWNSGMFVWRTDAVLAGLREHAPDVVKALEKARTKAAIERAYAALRSVSIDVALMEKAQGVRVLPIDYRWSDVGAWSALPDVVAPDPSGNFVANGARVFEADSTGNVVYADSNEIVALVGLKDVVVVRAGRATLVCPRERAQDVKKIVTRLEAEAPEHL